MAYTASQVLKAALQRILVQASEADLEADEYQDAILALNAMMASWAADGIDLGYTDIDNLADEITVPPGAIRGIIANLAIEVAPDYGGKVGPTLAQQAVEGMKAIRRIAIRVLPTQFPGNLPIGSGATEDGYSEPYYEPDTVETIVYKFKDPDDVVSYRLDWADTLNLSDPADTISTSSWDAESGITVDSDSNTTSTATVTLSSGTAGNVYVVTNTIVTAGGSTYNRSISVVVTDQ